MSYFLDEDNVHGDPCGDQNDAQGPNIGGM